jgi:hypothetical protein
MNYRHGPQVHRDDNYFGYDSDIRNVGPIREDTIPFLDLDELRKEERSSEKTSIQIFKLILAKSHEKIKRTNKTSDQRMCYYDIPHFLPGYPVFDVEAAKMYVAEQLHRNGIYVEDAGPSKIFLSWRPTDINLAAYEFQSQKRIQKNDVYKISISPLDQRNSPDSSMKPKIIRGSNSKPKKGSKSVTLDDESVSMMQYDKNLADLVPVNAKKVSAGRSERPIEVEEDLQEEDVEEEVVAPKKKRKHKSSSEQPMPQYQQPTMPQYQQPTMPQYQQPTMPQYQQPTMPQYQQPTMPQYQPPYQQSIPHYQQNISPQNQTSRYHY